MKNYVAARVVAVPVCRPARPAKDASIVRRCRRRWKHVVCTWKCIIRGWKCNVCGWQHIILVWKRRYAGVRAGTQAPPLPFQHLSPFCKGENKKIIARSNAASDKMQKTMLAVTLQTIKRKKQRSQ